MGEPRGFITPEAPCAVPAAPEGPWCWSDAGRSLVPTSALPRQHQSRANSAMASGTRGGREEMGTSKLSQHPVTCTQGLPSLDAGPDLPPLGSSSFLDPLEPKQALSTPRQPWQGAPCGRGGDNPFSMHSSCKHREPPTLPAHRAISGWNKA